MTKLRSHEDTHLLTPEELQQLTNKKVAVLRGLMAKGVNGSRTFKMFGLVWKVAYKAKRDIND